MEPPGTQQDSSLQSIGKYKILGPLGRGSMGVVYKAQDPEIGRVVAIKTLRSVNSTQFHDPKVALERFKLEARSAGNIRHPNIITVFDVNVEGDTPYIVMDYVEGESLDVILKEKGRLPVDQVLTYLEQVAGGLDSAHAAGVIHRDIKPSNLIVDAQNRIYILDFGVAKINKDLSESEKDGKPEPVMGTPGYMSPEQITNRKLDARTDLFSLAVVAFEALAGQRPFAGSNFTEIVGNILNGRILSLTSLVPDMPLALEVEFERALAKNVDDRYASAREMVGAFKTAVGVDRSMNFSNPASGQVARPRKKSEWKSLHVDEQETEAQRQPGAGARSEAAASQFKGGGWSDSRSSVPAPRPSLLDSPSRRDAGGAPGQMFAHGDDRGFGGAGALNSIRTFSLIRVLTTAFALSCIALGVGIFWLLGNRAQEPVAQLPVINEPIVTKIPEVPMGKNVVDMTSEEVLAILQGDGFAEPLVLQALREASNRGLPELADVASRPLANDSYVVRMETIRILSESGDKSVVKVLLPALNDHDPLVRQATAKAIGKFGSRASVSFLQDRYLQEEVSEVKRALKKAIEEINGFPMSE